MAITVTCVTCHADGPAVGADGYLGTPDVTTHVPQGTDPEELPFGHLYEPLREMGLRPRDLEEMYAFLQEHEGHQVVSWSSAQPAESVPAGLAAVLKRREVPGSAEAEDSAEDDVIELTAAPSEWAFSGFDVRCLECAGAGCVSEERDLLRRFESPLTVEPWVAEMMLSRWGTLAPDDGWNDGLRPLVDPSGDFVPRLLRFLRRHRHHRLQSRLLPIG